MRIIITGDDTSLGSAYKEFCLPRHSVIGIPKSEMAKGKEVIDAEIDLCLKLLPGKEELCLVNNFGYNRLSWIGTTPADDARIMNDNVMATYWAVNALARISKEPVRVLNIASASARVAQRCSSLYCASKAAVVQMTKVMARELAPKGWVVNALSPGLIEDTHMAELVFDQVVDLRGTPSDKALQYARDLIPMGRFTNCGEVVDAIDKVLQLPRYVNGANIEMMGGA